MLRFLLRMSEDSYFGAFDTWELSFIYSGHHWMFNPPRVRTKLLRDGSLNLGWFDDGPFDQPFIDQHGFVCVDFFQDDYKGDWSPGTSIEKYVVALGSLLHHPDTWMDSA